MAKKKLIDKLKTSKLSVKEKNKVPIVNPKKTKNFTVVAIGSSAGGLDAAIKLFSHLSAKTGMAYIYVQHLSPDYKSMLTSILGRSTRMKVQEIDDMEKLLPNNVFVIPNNRGIEVVDGHIKLTKRAAAGSAVTIDNLFTSLAETHKSNTIGIVLSGNAHDGTQGLMDIKAAGGITFAQDDSAQSKSMPHSAVASGMVDHTLSPEAIARELNRISLMRRNESLSKQPLSTVEEIVDNYFLDTDPDLIRIIKILNTNIGVDFSVYKLATIKRRIYHRMVQCGHKNLKEYYKHLSKKNNETDFLYKDLLINVTSFFRDPDTFTYLKKSLLPELLKSKTERETLRIWIPACSTGEEVYTLAILIAELQTKKNPKTNVQIFATDLSEQALKDARLGTYSEKELVPVGKRRAERFFKKTDGIYRVTKELRDMCVFANHNVLQNPPFSHIDFISCRNVLIYFDAAAQKKALNTLYFSLNSGGYLLLGKSETIGTSSSQFNQENNAVKLYTKKKSGTRSVNSHPFDSITKYSPEKYTERALGKKVTEVVDIDRRMNDLLLSHHMPACVLISKNKEILKFRGPTELYLTHPTGNASLNILKMARAEFNFELRNALQEVFQTNEPVFKSGIIVKRLRSYFPR